MLCRFLLVGILHVLAIAIFSSGFLLSRTALTDRSVCQDGAASEPPFSRLVLLVVDAWRYDFALDFRNGTATAGSPYLDKMKRLHGLLRDHPLKTFLARFRADPPTTTLQRLKALTTGSLPTFVEAGSNFGGSEIEEDNLLFQLVREKGRRLVFAGDDTWMSLFPMELGGNNSHPYPSLNVWDLDTVDRGCIKHLFPTLRGERGPWDVMIAHFLGVDHAGHRYGPGHPEMERKLVEMDRVIGDVVELLEEHDLLVVLGDHGMDAKGDHGGDSALEVDAALFAYSPKGFFASPTEKVELERLAEILRSRGLDGTFGEDPMDTLCVGSCRTVSQIDLVPTLALLLGLPIPFQNLGALIPELAWGAKPRVGSTPGTSLRWLVDAHRINADQVLTYLERYSAISPRELPSSHLAELRQLHTRATQDADSSSSNDDNEKALLSYALFLRTSLLYLRRIWARFDVLLMITGTVILGASLLASPAIASLPLDRLIRLGWRGFLLGFLFLRATLVLGNTFQPRIMPTWNVVRQILVGGAIGGCLAMLVALVRGFDSRDLGVSKLMHLSYVVPALGVGLGMGSVKFVLWEDFYVLVLSVLVVCAATIWPWMSNGSTWTPLGTLFAGMLATAAVLLPAYGTICREEQLPSCVPTFYSSPSSSVPSIMSLTLMACTHPLAPVLFARAAKSDSGLGGKQAKLYGAPRLIIDLLYPLLLAFASAYWILDAYLQNGGSGFGWMGKVAIERTRTVVIVRYLWLPIVSAAWAAWWSSPTSVDAKETPTGESIGGRPWKIVGAETSVRAGAMAALATVHATLSLFQKGLGGLAFDACVLLLLLLVFLPIPDGALAGAAVPLALHYFFRTGHQAVLATLDWGIGFVGLQHVHYVISPMMVMANFAGVFLLIGAAVPLLCLVRRGPRAEGDIGDHNVLRATLVYSSGFALILLLSMASCIVLRRHLMVWKVFAPRLMLAALSVLATDVGCLVGLACVTRLEITAKTLEDARRRFKLQ